MVLPHDAFLAVIADGAGSAAMGEFGAEIAVNTVVAQLRRALEEGRSDFGALLREAAVQARKSVVSEAIKQGLEPRSFASTLLVIMLVPEGGAALQIGDGVMVVSDGGNGWSWVFWPQRGEYANTTYFLTDDDAIERVQVETFSAAISDVALMSDGLEPLALHLQARRSMIHFLTVCSVRYSNLTDPQKSFIYRNHCNSSSLLIRSDHEPTTMYRLSWPRAEIKTIPNDATHLGSCANKHLSRAGAWPWG